ncbi:MAG: UvrD-helicase domain-containing protein [Bacteroidia bacterium]
MKQLTDEQQAILATTGDLKINAVAGSGKTTTLVEYARTRPKGSKILYLAFNRTVREEASKRFAGFSDWQIKAETAHSLAYKAVVKGKKLQLSNGFKAYELADFLKIKSKDPEIRYLLATHSQRYLNQFLNSPLQKHTELNYAASLTEPASRNFADRFAEDLVGFTGKLLQGIESGALACPHDYYLKQFQLKHPRLSFDYILFDEGQDASGVMLHILLRQSATKLVVGDVHQQIYGWRQAVNSLQQLPFPTCHLSNSFRFPPEIADMAMRVLSWKQLLPQPFESMQITGLGKTAKVANRATLARSNLFLLDRAIQLLQNEQVSGIWFEGNLSAYTFASDGTSIFDVLALQRGAVHKVKDALLRGLGSFEKLEEYLEKAEEPELAMITEMVRKYGDALPGYINALKNLHVAPNDRHKADMIFSTVHRSKGLEYDEVQLTTDFVSAEKIHKSLLEADKHKLHRLNEEINLLYVAMTRARYQLKLPVSLWPPSAVSPVIPESTEMPAFRRRRPNYINSHEQQHWEWGRVLHRLEEPDETYLHDWLQDEMLQITKEDADVPDD